MSGQRDDGITGGEVLVATDFSEGAALAATYGVHVRGELLEGHPVAQIMACAQRWQPCCLVMRAEGANRQPRGALSACRAAAAPVPPLPPAPARGR